MKEFEGMDDKITFTGTVEDIYWLLNNNVDYTTDPYDASGRSDQVNFIETAKNIFKSIKDEESTCKKL